MPSLDNSFSLQARAEDITLIDTCATPRVGFQKKLLEIFDVQAQSGLVFGEDFQTDLLGNRASLTDEPVYELFQDTTRNPT